MHGDLTDAATPLLAEAADQPSDDPVRARRLEVVGRLLERGMPVRVLEALLPGWDDAIRSATRSEPPAA